MRAGAGARAGAREEANSFRDFVLPPSDDAKSVLRYEKMSNFFVSARCKSVTEKQQHRPKTTIQGCLKIIRQHTCSCQNATVVRSTRGRTDAKRKKLTKQNESAQPATNRLLTSDRPVSREGKKGQAARSPPVSGCPRQVLHPSRRFLARSVTLPRILTRSLETRPKRSPVNCSRLIRSYPPSLTHRTDVVQEALHHHHQNKQRHERHDWSPVTAPDDAGSALLAVGPAHL